MSPPLMPGVQGAAARKGPRLVAARPAETPDGGWICPHCSEALDIEALVAVLRQRGRL